MSTPRRPHPSNVPGDWYVDDACIDCGAARDLAPDLITRSGGQSVFTRQPTTPADEREAWLAALACPTASVRTTSGRKPPAAVFPQELGPGVFRCGYNSRKSFGAHSYFVTRAGGNFLIDSPRYLRALADFFERHGGITDVLLTHRDDVADADRYADRFSARVWIHVHDRAAAPYATDLIRGDAPVELRDGMRAVPTPGHTRGSVCYLLDETYLFTGDTLAWSHPRKRLDAHRAYCWYSWDAQRRSLGRLAQLGFDYVLAGHGGSRRLPRETIEAELRRLARAG